MFHRQFLLLVWNQTRGRWTPELFSRRFFDRLGCTKNLFLLSLRHCLAPCDSTLCFKHGRPACAIIENGFVLFWSKVKLELLYAYGRARFFRRTDGKEVGDAELSPLPSASRIRTALAGAH